MSIQNNFNKLVYLKKFNNYFNRKIFGGDLNDYFYGESGSTQTITVKFKISDLTEYNPHGISVLKTVLEALPFGILIDNVSVSFENLGAVDFSFNSLANQNPDKKAITLLFNDNSDYLTDFSDNFRIVFTYSFVNREYFVADNINFNQNNGVFTQIVANNIPFTPDYLLVLDPTDNAIISRWFVVQKERFRNEQYNFALKRDVIYDKINDLLEAPIYVHKGMLEESDPFVVNSEGMEVNQIKTKEARLLDKTGISWLVLYIAKNTPAIEFVDSGSSVKFKISTTKVKTFDQPYDIVVIPFYPSYFQGLEKNVTIIDLDNTEFTTNSNRISLGVEKLLETLDANLYDVQILPYCPYAENFMTLEGKIKLSALDGGGEGYDFDYITYGGGSTKIGICLYIESSTFECNVYPENNASISTSLSKKEASNLELYRFVSPNYQGTFDFNIGKNDNDISLITAYCTYKPYTPFIKVSPQFKKFYGSNYKDARGLICGGDFSSPRTTEAWQSYQLQNKNYQNIFNREIQNLEFNQSLEMRNQIISAVVGHFAATGAGAAAGAYVGGWVGAIVGGAVAGTASLVSGIVDIITINRKQREEKSLMIDKYNYQLGNIKALPYTLTQVGSFDCVSKIFPFVEIYDCTDKELEAFRLKIKYESMTVMRIDSLQNYYNKFDNLCYFKGELIINDKIAEDTYFLEAIYAEFMKGVYI